VARRVASARDIAESPRYAAGPVVTRNVPAGTCIMTATQKYRTSPLPAAIPGGFAEPASSRVASVRFAHPFAVVAAAFHDPRTMTQAQPERLARAAVRVVSCCVRVAAGRVPEPDGPGCVGPLRRELPDELID
jgi:hypothetical protein